MIKLAIEAGKASPAPPIGPALGSAGANIMMFCKEYNARTQDKMGSIIPVEITVYDDRSFTFITKTPPASELLKKAAGAAKGSGTPFGRGSVNVGSVTLAQVLMGCTFACHQDVVAARHVPPLLCARRSRSCLLVSSLDTLRPAGQVEEIAKIKLPDLNTNKVDSAMRTVMGTARNMGITIKEE